MKSVELKEKIVALRKENGLTQLAVAEKLEVSRQAISRWESGVALPSTDNLKSLSALYGVPVDYLLNDTIERGHDKGQAGTQCSERTVPQKRDKTKTKRVVISVAILLLVAVVVIACAVAKERAKQNILIEKMEKESVDTSSEGEFQFEW